MVLNCKLQNFFWKFLILFRDFYNKRVQEELEKLKLLKKDLTPTDLKEFNPSSRILNKNFL